MTAMMGVTILHRHVGNAQRAMDILGLPRFRGPAGDGWAYCNGTREQVDGLLAADDVTFYAHDGTDAEIGNTAVQDRWMERR